MCLAVISTVYSVMQAVPVNTFKALELQRTSKRISLFLRCCLQQLFVNLRTDEEVVLFFSKVRNSELKRNFGVFLQKTMGPWLADLEASQERDSLLLKVKFAEDALRAV